MRSVLVPLLLLASPGLVHAAVTWRAAPEVVVAQEGHGGGHGGHGGGAHDRSRPLNYYLRDGTAAEVVLNLPDITSRPLAIDAERVAVVSTGMEGYHRVVARRVAAGEEQVALRYFFSPGKPSGHSPKELLAAAPARLEIVPAPLPREHWRYETSEAAVFLIRFDGALLANVPVSMTTSNGTLLDATSDASGVVRFVLPEDFARVGPSREANRPADFVVTVNHHAGETNFTTALNADYHVNPGHWQSTAAGGALLLAGFAAGLVLVRPREEKNA